MFGTQFALFKRIFELNGSQKIAVDFHVKAKMLNNTQALLIIHTFTSIIIEI